MVMVDIKDDAETFDPSLIGPKYLEVAPMLRGLGPGVQACVIAELFACLLAGHVIVDRDSKTINSDETEKYRAKMIENWLTMVRDLIPGHEARIYSKPAEETAQ